MAARAVRQTTRRSHWPSPSRRPPPRRASVGAGNCLSSAARAPIGRSGGCGRAPFPSPPPLRLRPRSLIGRRCRRSPRGPAPAGLAGTGRAATRPGAPRARARLPLNPSSPWGSGESPSAWFLLPEPFLHPPPLLPSLPSPPMASLCSGSEKPLLDSLQVQGKQSVPVHRVVLPVHLNRGCWLQTDSPALGYALPSMSEEGKVTGNHREQSQGLCRTHHGTIFATSALSVPSGSALQHSYNYH